MIRRALFLAALTGALAPLARAEDIVLYDDNSSRHNGRNALVALGYSYTTANSSNFVTYLNSGTYEVAVVDMPSNLPTGAWQTALSNFVSRGGKVVMGYWVFQGDSTLNTLFSCQSASSLSYPGPLYRWDSSHPIFTTPYAVPNITAYADMWADDGDELRATGSATLLMGYSSTSSASRGAIALANSGKTLYNGFLWDSYSGDSDGDGTADIVELIANQIYFLIHGGCDADDDGYDAAAGTCGGDDCDDSDPTIHPGADETPYDGVDEDCDGSDLTDYDGDGWDAATVGGADCDDTDASVHPGAPETADGVDEDCDDTVDEGTRAYDDDGDGFSEDGGDCNDAASGAHPGGSETCDGVDED
ncbi:MAG: putative metal-binding motif-containing protein, partial [Myxococcota bacterium]